MTENKPFNIGAVLKNLPSDEAKANMIGALVDHVQIEKSYVLSAIEVFKNKEPLRGARLAKRVGENALSQEMYAKAAEAREKTLQWNDAAEIFIEAGMKERALDDLEKAGNSLRAAALAEELNLDEKAATLYERASKLTDAARVYEKLGNAEKSSDLYEKSGLVWDAFRVASKANLAERAAMVWVRRGKPEVGALAAKNRGLNELADSLYKKAIDARVGKANASFDDYDQASYLAKEAGWFDQAISLCERGINSATNKDERKVMVERTIRYCEEAKQLERAEAYKMMKNLFKELKLI